jgi:hypothetical protein
LCHNSALEFCGEAGAAHVLTRYASTQFWPGSYFEANEDIQITLDLKLIIAIASGTGWSLDVTDNMCVRDLGLRCMYFNLVGLPAALNTSDHQYKLFLPLQPLQ